MMICKDLGLLFLILILLPYSSDNSITSFRHDLVCITETILHNVVSYNKVCDKSFKFNSK
jgi:hypothetical protein